ncbi:non-hydrolyzing UDP-N-acetylglucosamine 2-epimerase [Haloarchaeobius sp. TZWWS8]|uniref:non-hydrolyzing UDP-N-acetylglucosamine 2-epimerase n=1 Tax=Haloarchaeobius sp. TZWWS8 TaxID=3446121 RepID=UPI003EC0D7EF
MSETKLAIVLGTRPEIIKLAPVVKACEANDVPYTLVHTGQHYSEELDEVFFDQLELPTPDYNLGVGSKPAGTQTGEMMIELESVLEDEDVDAVLVQGDTNSVVAGAMVASKMDIEIGHIEAGLRSYDRSMPEEHNRIVTDHVADYLFAPTNESRIILLDEGIDDERIHVTGNTVVDALLQNQEIAAEKSTVLAELGLEDQRFGLLTAHRAGNVDDEDRFESLLQGASRAADELGIELVYPVHPRAENMLEEFDLAVPDNIRTIDAQDYLDFIHLQSRAEIILTDSGGVQEEACVLGTPCVTLRDNTERPETVDVGANQLAGVDPDAIVEAAREMHAKEGDWDNPLGDGDAALQILELVLDREVAPVTGVTAR